MVKRKIALLALCAVVLWCAPVQGAKKSTSEERKRAVEGAKELEKDPLGANAKEKLTELLKWWTEVPDLTLTWCANMLTEELKDADSDLAGAIVAQAPLTAGAAMIENPEVAKDKRAFAIIGLEGALRAYRAAVAKHAGKKNDFLEGLSKEGALGAYVDSKLPSCK